MQSDKVLNLPAGYFGIVLGTIGMGFAWRYASQVWQVSHWLGDGLVILAMIIWGLLTSAFIARLIRFPHSVLAEAFHPFHRLRAAVHIADMEIGEAPAAFQQRAIHCVECAQKFRPPDPAVARLQRGVREDDAAIVPFAGKVQSLVSVPFTLGCCDHAKVLLAA